MTGYKTYLAGAGLLGLALYEVSQKQYHDAAQHFFAGLTVLGVGHKLQRLIGATWVGKVAAPAQGGN